MTSKCSRFLFITNDLSFADSLQAPLKIKIIHYHLSVVSSWDPTIKMYTKPMWIIIRRIAKNFTWWTSKSFFSTVDIITVHYTVQHIICASSNVYIFCIWIQLKARQYLIEIEDLIWKLLWVNIQSNIWNWEIYSYFWRKKIFDLWFDQSSWTRLASEMVRRLWCAWIDNDLRKPT